MPQGFPPGGLVGGSVRTGAGQALPGGFPRRLRRGSPAFSGESRRKERRGLRPLDPRFYNRSFPLAGFWDRYSWYDSGAVSSDMLKPIWNAFFREEICEKAFCERRFPNQGTYMGLVIAPPPGQCATTAKTSEWQRAGHKKRGGRGHPPATLCVRAFSRESLDPPPGTGQETTWQVLTCEGPNRTTCRRQRRPARLFQAWPLTPPSGQRREYTPPSPPPPPG